MTFVVSGIAGTVTGARLHLYATDGSVDSGTVYSSSTAWSESSITWKTAPAVGNRVLAVHQPVAGAAWTDIALDPTAFSGAATYSVVLASSSADLAAYSSRETTRKPQLLIDVATPTPMPTLTPTPTVTPTDPPTPAPSPTVAPTQDPTASSTAIASPDPSPSPIPTPDATGSAEPSLPATASSSPASPYTFDDEFDGTTLGSVWQRDFNFGGIENTWSMTQDVVANGVLAITANRAAGAWVSGLLDTKGLWVQQYGYFEARMKVPVGKGLWPAFWTYASSSTSESEIDGMEVCANPLGLNGGNDVSLLHQTVHWSGGSAGFPTRTVDLSLDYHVYAFDWRPDHITFYLDGAQMATFTDATRIPNVPLPLIMDLAVGGTWCSGSDTTTPDGSQLLVDWVRVRA